MRLSITKAIHDIGQSKFHKMMLAGAFPEINYSVTYGKDGTKWESYNMMKYSTTWASFMKAADVRIKEKTGDRLGVFTRKHSALFLSEIRNIFDSITEADVFIQTDRFKTWCD